MSESSTENRKPIIRLRVSSARTDSILHAFVARDRLLLADVSVHPTEEVRSIARDLLSQEPTKGWDALNVRRSKIKGLRFHVYELMQGTVPQIWTYACVYDSLHVKKNHAQHFLKTIVSLTEVQRYCDETWREGDYRACRDTVAPILLKHMQHVNANRKAVENSNLDYCKRIIQANRSVLNEINKRKKEADKILLRGTSELNDEETTVAFSVKEVYLDATTSTDSLSDESESGIFDSLQSVSTISEITSSKPKKRSSSLGFRGPGAAAQLIQKRWRGILVRQKYTTYLKSIVWIQRVFRAHTLRKRAQLEYESALCLQRHFRSPSQHRTSINRQVSLEKKAHELNTSIEADDDDGDPNQKPLKDPASPSSVLDIERIGRSRDRNPKEAMKEPGSLADHQERDGKSGDSSPPQQAVVVSMLTKMQLAARHNRDRLESLKKSHAHLSQEEGHQDESSLQEVAAERDQAWNQVAHVVEQLADSDAEIAALKSNLSQTRNENAVLKEQLAEQQVGTKSWGRKRNKKLASS